MKGCVGQLKAGTHDLEVAAGSNMQAVGVAFCMQPPYVAVGIVGRL